MRNRCISLCHVFKAPISIFKHNIYSGLKIYFYRSEITRQSKNNHKATTFMSDHTDLYNIRFPKLTSFYVSSTPMIINHYHTMNSITHSLAYGFSYILKLFNEVLKIHIHAIWHLSCDTIIINTVNVSAVILHIVSYKCPFRQVLRI